MNQKPTIMEVKSPPLVFSKQLILGKEVYICSRSRFQIAKKRPKKSAFVVKEFSSSQKDKAIDAFNECWKNSKVGEIVYLLVSTDEVDQETVCAVSAE